MNVPLMYNFRSLSNKFPTIFGSLIFTFHFLVRLFFAEKRKPKIFGLKNAMEREIRKKKLFSARLASVWFKNKGWGPEPLGPSPGFTTNDVSYRLFINYSSSPNGL